MYLMARGLKGSCPVDLGGLLAVFSSRISIRTESRDNETDDSNVSPTAFVHSAKNSSS